MPIRALVRLMRPRQWTKNAIVFAALVFDHKLGDWSRFAIVVGAFVAFCLASSAIYLINDLRDAESDRLHPAKRNRPIASGVVSPRLAMVTALLLLAVALPLATALKPAFGLVVAGYVLLMVGYSLFLKHLVILDVFAIAAGFVLRAAGGAVVIGVPISPWLYVCTILLALFIGFGKRRHELLLLEGGAASHRRNLEEYSAELLDHFILITAAATVMAYSLYTFAAESLPDDHSMMLTIPFVLYALFRYLFLVHRRDAGGSPGQTLLTDLPLLGCIVAWGVVTIVLLYR
ncbi:MAG TPA: decaprenyl-phosphate phosphoribosyltransferase [Thermomicrobiales bacterium]|nr:decaprenyl-phosphate phosphoribosyltransferase [Thermomicrobiales bacterium]